LFLTTHLIAGASILCVSCNRPETLPDRPAQPIESKPHLETSAGVTIGPNHRSQTRGQQRLDQTLLPRDAQPSTSLADLEALLVRRPEVRQDYDKRVALVKEIGERKLVEAIPLIIRELLNISPRDVWNEMDFEDSYPGSKALIQIGKPALLPVQAQFANSSSAKEQLVLLYVLARIGGSQPTADWLEEVRENEPVADRKSHLSKLQEWVRSLEQ